MTRSKRRMPACGFTTAESDKEFKKQEHRVERRKERDLMQKVLAGDEDAAQELKHEQQPFNDLKSEKDGKQWLGRPGDPYYDEKLMRK